MKKKKQPFEKFEKSNLEKLRRIGKGGFGDVYLCKNRRTGELVAVKKLHFGDGFNQKVGQREISVLPDLKHPNVIELLGFFKSRYNLNLVYPYMETDLYSVLNSSQYSLSESDVKSFMFQILSGLAYLHSVNVLHRDLNPTNVLLSSQKPLKIADFGLALKASQNKRFKSNTPRCVTLNYRPPEILLGEDNLGFGVDIWSCACVFVEIVTRKKLFKENREWNVMCEIFDVLGDPNEKTWPGVMSLKNSSLCLGHGDDSNKTIEPLEKVLPQFSKPAIDLLKKMLVLNPKKRISAQEALKHPYFTQGVKMTPVEEFQVKEEKQCEEMKGVTNEGWNEENNEKFFSECFPAKNPGNNLLPDLPKNPMTNVGQVEDVFFSPSPQKFTDDATLSSGQQIKEKDFSSPFLAFGQKLDFSMKENTPEMDPHFNEEEDITDDLIFGKKLFGKDFQDTRDSDGDEKMEEDEDNLEEMDFQLCE